MNVQHLSYVFIPLLTLIVLITNVQARQICKVTDPTGTPLNVRDSPNGKVINSLQNGREVEIVEIDYDQKDRPWVKVGRPWVRAGESRIWGWVIREFISCYED
ncbi:MAG: hypothetical protein RLZZ568_1333 [Cyanobacteriota bacterium]|jgi:hypothetical protein